jgi:SAM-dependent methyltransferase
MDELSQYNQSRWDELARSNVAFARPLLDLDQESARQIIDPHGLFGDLAGKQVLCLASGGGQQSAAAGLLGAQVTVFDLSPAQLERDRLAAEHFGLQVRAVQGDMRDLSAFLADTFDVVWQGYSINFVPDVQPVFQEVARVLRPGGFYLLELGNPFTQYSVDDEAWDGNGYPLKYPYLDGAEISQINPNWGTWDVDAGEGRTVKVKGPKEFRHRLSTVVNALAQRGFVILALWEDLSGLPEAEPGSWEHFKACAPTYLQFWMRYLPAVLAQS